MTLREYKHVHCIGIGGIGLSAIARYCNSQGAVVTGSDTSSSRVTEELQKEGITVYYGHSIAHVASETELVIYSIAVTDSNPELKEAKERGITCLTYPEALGSLTKEYTTIAVCGTHGKTTTTAMIAEMLKSVGKDPTVIVGSLLKEKGTNFVEGTSEYLVVEACEYRRSFLELFPSHIVITNIDEDHLDYYKDIKDIESAFSSFVAKLGENSFLVTHGDITLKTKAKKTNADEIDIQSIHLSVPGLHNKMNAQLALSLASALSLNLTKAREGLLNFTGTWRRLEYKGDYKGATLYDDYGHHPKEIKATLLAIREKYPKSTHTLITFFQPHLYSRTKLLLNEFAKSFDDSDSVCILPIYAAREEDDGSISSQQLVEKIKGATFIETFADAKKYIDSHAKNGTIILTIGAGDIYLLHDMLK